MSQFYNKILSICLSFFELFSTASFSVELHYCCDKLIDIGFFEQAETCETTTHSNYINSCDFSDESCCHNNQLIKIGQDDLKNSFSNYFNYVTKILIDNNISYFDLFHELKEKTTSITDYRPPLLLTDITILYETFLI